MPVNRLLTRRQASAYLRERFGISYSPTTLRTMACRGGPGPLYSLIGHHAFYDPRDLDEWIAQRLSAKRTSSRPNLSPDSSATLA